MFPNKRITLPMVHGLYKGIKLNVSINNQLGLIAHPIEPAFQDFLKRYLKAGDLAFDVGANIGYTSILASRIVGPKGHVYSFEPIPDNISVFKKNCRLNNCQNISLIEKALSTQKEEVEFNIPENGHGLSMSSMVWGKTSKGVKKQRVSCICIDQEPSFNDLSPKTIKIDVEGAEGYVIEGMQQLISRCRPILYIECSEIGRETSWNILTSLNYRCFSSDNKVEIGDFEQYAHADFIWVPNKS